MNITRQYDRDVHTVRDDATATDAALRMDDGGVGSLVVLDADDRPVGMITDRDLTLRVVAAGLAPAETRVADVMSKRPVVASPADSVDAVLRLMESFGVRRIPIVEDRKCRGLVSVDDLLLGCTRDLFAVSQGVRCEFADTRWRAQVEHLTSLLEQRFDDALHWAGDAGIRTKEAADRIVRELRTRVLGDHDD